MTIKECMQLQSSFNEIVNPSWKKASYAWRRAMWVESAELVDHLGYKWWKDVNKEWDKKQVLLELVDIFHFLISEAIINNKTPENILSSFEWAKRHTYAPTKEKKIKQVEEFVMLCLESNQSILSSYFQVVFALEFDISDVLKYYIGKNALNKLRQDNGYKTGEYKKEWNINGELLEDNKVLEKIIETSTNITFASIYDQLDSQYSAMLK
jgi:dimeric dUTPase (all-alpha-NTP-PPase superfamily)